MKKCDGRGILWLEPGNQETLIVCPGCKFCGDRMTELFKKSGLLTEKEKEALRRGGVQEKDLSVTMKAMTKCIRDMNSDYVDFLRKCLTVKQAASMLSVPETEVIERLEGNPPRLLGLRFRSYWLLPAEQIHEGRVIPNFEKVLAGFDEPSDNVLAISSWLKLQNIDLQVGRQQLSPREWLIRGLPLKEVLRLVEDFDIVP